MSATHVTIKIPKELVEEMDKLLGKHGFRSRGEIAKEAIRQFSSSQSIEATRQQYMRTADSCQSFIEEQTEITTDPDAIIPDETLYQTYVAYCNTQKLPIQKKAQLTISMQRNRPEAKHTTERIQGKTTHAWQYLKFVTTVTTVTSLLLLSEDSELQNYRKREVPVTAVTVVTPERVCGQCDLWHKGGCCFPGDPSCVAPTNPYAQDCRSFIINGGGQ